MKRDKTGGREKGTPNNVTKEARELFTQTLEGQVPRLKIALDEVFEQDKDRFVELFTKLAPYFMPKKYDVTTKEETLKPVIINVLPLIED